MVTACPGTGLRSSTIPGGAPVVSEMAALVRAQGGTLLFKAHDRTDLRGDVSSDAIVLPKEADLNAYLGLCDVIVTDFSSVANDFMMLQRPIVHFCPDFANGRGFAFDPGTRMPGLLTRTKDELYEVLGDFRSLPLCADLDELVAIYWNDTAQPGACARIAAFIEAAPLHR